jgi:hypothetical protein
MLVADPVMVDFFSVAEWYDVWAAPDPGEKLMQLRPKYTYEGDEN